MKKIFTIRSILYLLHHFVIALYEFVVGKGAIDVVFVLFTFFAKPVWMRKGFLVSALQWIMVKSPPTTPDPSKGFDTY